MLDALRLRGRRAVRRLRYASICLRAALAALHLATLGSASALGLGDELGSLAPGKRADVTVVSVAGTPYHPIEDPTVAAVFAGSPGRVMETIVEGQTRYRRGVTEWPEVRSTASAARRQMLA